MSTKSQSEAEDPARASPDGATLGRNTASRGNFELTLKVTSIDYHRLKLVSLPPTHHVRYQSSSSPGKISWLSLYTVHLPASRSSTLAATRPLRLMSTPRKVISTYVIARCADLFDAFKAASVLLFHPEHPLVSTRPLSFAMVTRAHTLERARSHFARSISCSLIPTFH